MIRPIDEFFKAVDAGIPLIHVSERDIPTLLEELAKHKEKEKGSTSVGIYLFVCGVGLFNYSHFPNGNPKVLQIQAPNPMGAGPAVPISDPELMMKIIVGASVASSVLKSPKNVIFMIMERDMIDRNPSIPTMMKSLYNGSDKLFRLSKAGEPEQTETGTEHADSIETHTPKKGMTVNSIILAGEGVEPPSSILSHCYVFGSLKMDLPFWVRETMVYADKEGKEIKAVKTDKDKDKKPEGCNAIHKFPKETWEHLTGLIQNECTFACMSARLSVKDITKNGGDEVKKVHKMIDSIREIRRGIYTSNNVVTEINSAITMNQVGGYERVKEYVIRRKKLVEKMDIAKESGIRMKGIFLVGIPGSGKTILLEAMGKEWGLPGYELNLNLALGRYVGESESRLQSGFDTLKKLAPCFCLIDEVDKVLAGVGEGQTAGSDVPLRIFGMLLRAMNEDNDVIFGVSANRVKSLPQEFMRKGRFDKMFFLDVPTASERAQVFAIHMAKRKQDITKISEKDFEKIVKDTKGFSGAEIESVVNEAVSTSIIEDKPLSASMIDKEIATCKLIDTSRTEIQELRTWATSHAERASSETEES